MKWGQFFLFPGTGELLFTAPTSAQVFAVSFVARPASGRGNASLGQSSTPLAPWVSSFLRVVGVVALTAAVYIGLASLEVGLSFPHPARGTLWWSGGWGVAAVTLFGRRAVPGVLLGEWLTASGLFQLPLWMGLMTGTGNALEAVLGAWVLGRCGFRPALDRKRDVATLGVAAAIAPLPVLALQGMAGWLEGWYANKPLLRDMAIWWANDALGTVYVVPFAAACTRWAAVRAEWAGRWLEVAALLVGFAGVTALSFGTGGGYWQAGLTAAAFPFLAWAALRFGPRTTAAALVVYATAIVVCVARRLDPFPDTGSNSCFPFLHLVLALVAGSALLLAAVAAERAAAVERARAASRWEGLAALASGLAHDLNNRLTVVVGAVELTRQALPPNSPTQRYMTAATDAVSQMSRLTTELLAYSGRGVRSVAVPVDVDAVAREAARETTGRVSMTGPAGGGAVMLTADPALLQMAIRHLVANGIESSADAGVTVTVTAEALQAADLDGGWPVEGKPGRYARVQVTDNGDGMTAEVVRQMFDPFFTTKFVGRGLGLAVVAGVVRQLRGHIRVTSRPAAGTTVNLYLPLSSSQ